ncbi:RNA polymerase sigma factor [Anaerocolumna sp. MB42-C2]|uniref:RNA polymerase sigma factor n=1 Tax=Anaerocolumna sp. MB42-C2 TaxID=3070997 RepID=UPI0027E182DA|nr:sigma-70 family RNA polymerase sigma factor [Anaerocolumna sp. MB42-C2]WMJ90715.1 sigma-70 family RNA polymerase sigma factor [Anaerocolumna sp. MB42-C2]
MEKYADSIFRCAYSYCGNRMDAEDVIQEVFLKYMRKHPEFKDLNHERAWFLRVTINTAKDYVNSFWYRKTEALNENILYENEQEKDIWELVQQLPKKYRLIIQLFYQEGYSIKEISYILKTRESTVGTQLSRAREMLKNKFEEE